MSSESGVAGDLTINTTGTEPLLLDNSRIRAVTGLGEDGSNIELNLDNPLLVMAEGSRISSSARNAAQGGDVTIALEDGFIIGSPLLGNNDILADAEDGVGGQVTVRALELFGFETRSRADLEALGEVNVRNLPTNDISAVSQGNPDVASQGIVNVTTLGLDPNRGVIELPSAFSGPQINQNCSATGTGETSEFTSTGRGGLPPSPSSVLTRDRTLADLGPGAEFWAEAFDDSAEDLPDASVASESITEAEEWMVDEQGDVVLIAQAPDATPHDTWNTLGMCQAAE